MSTIPSVSNQINPNRPWERQIRSLNRELQQTQERARRRGGPSIRTGRLDPIAYTYEAAYHCPTCAASRFGVDEEGWIPESATDREGNPVGAVAPWDEWQSFSGEPETLACDTCARVIDTYTPDNEGAEQ